MLLNGAAHFGRRPSNMKLFVKLSYSHPDSNGSLCLFSSLWLSPNRCIGENLQPNNRTVPMQGWCNRRHVQPVCEGLPAESLPHCALHQYVYITLNDRIKPVCKGPGHFTIWRRLKCTVRTKSQVSRKSSTGNLHFFHSYSITSFGSHLSFLSKVQIVSILWKGCLFLKEYKAEKLHELKNVIFWNWARTVW